jgi:LmbE family N-acetylglucosaminyl deacetylase
VSTAADFAGVTLLGVFAHPDDESLACGALLAAAAERGARTALLCLTRGEAGPGGVDPERLAEVRTAELGRAARALGVTDVTILDHHDGMLPFIAPGVLEHEIARTIRRVGCDVAITFDLDGLYWHPDHVAVHERVTAAVAALGEAAPALWYASMPEGVMTALAAAAPGATPPFGVADPDAFGALAPAPTVVLHDERAAERKIAAILCHRSQTDGTALALADPRLAASLLATEHYRRADVGARGETLVERLSAAAASARA